MSGSAGELAAGTGAMLRGMGYQEGTIRNYRACWSKVVAFCDENGIEEYDEGAERSFFASEGIGPIPGLARHQRDRVRHVRCLLTAKDGRPPRA